MTTNAPTYAFDPTYGYTLDTLLQVGAPDEPADFAKFWRDTYEQTRSVPTRVEKRKVAGPEGNFDTYEVEYDSLGGFRVGGWLTIPRDGVVQAAVVCGHGYGGRDAVDAGTSRFPCIAIYPCGRGFHRSSGRGYPGNSAEHVVKGIEARETYSHRECVADIWAAATVALELFPHAAERLYYQGGSFGGGMGAMALPWDPRFVRGYLDVPSFGNHPLRVTMQCVGSGEAVRQRYLRDPGVMQVLRYFDSATAAKHIRVPTLVAAAKYDPAVPPPGQFAVYNAIPAVKKLVVRTASHCEHPNGAAEDQLVRSEIDKWCGFVP